MTIFSHFSCIQPDAKKVIESADSLKGCKLVILGNLQDGGSPHAGCNKPCCTQLFINPDPNRKVACLGLIDYDYQKNFLIEASPDFTEQAKQLKRLSPFTQNETPDGIFLTHAHIGHYTGLMELGREVMGAKKVPVYCMPGMKKFLETNGPWNQLVQLENILLHELHNETWLKLTPNISIMPVKVPHRDEYSETVGFWIKGKTQTVLFIPDIDKWQKWDKDIREEIRKVDYAFLDATFYDSTELKNRRMSEVPHPFVLESIKLFENLPLFERQKINFIHLNHTNPLLISSSHENIFFKNQGYKIAAYLETFGL